MQRMTFKTFLIVRILRSGPLLLVDVPPLVFSPSHDSTILLLYVDLFLSKVPCTPPFASLSTQRSYPERFCFHMVGDSD